MMNPSDSHLLLRALVDELARCGMTNAVTCPGSRNTPIVEAVVREPRIRAWSHLDERSGGFFAVGAAKASGTPVAVTVTSGSAVANLMPAVVEASEARLPLIILSADRPAELRQIGAGQTIDQVKIFGPYVRFFAELDLYEATAERMRWVRTMACRAYLESQAPNGGPVHLNIPLREPLVLDQPVPADPSGGEGRLGGAPWVSSPPRPLPAAELSDANLARTVIVAGASTLAGGATVARYAARTGIPLLADPPSAARRGAAAIAHYDLLLRDPSFTATHRPQAVLRVGELPTSKPLRTWLAGLTAAPGDRGEMVAQVSVGPERVWNDPASVVLASVVGDPVAVFDAAGVTGDPDPGWLSGWRRADRAAATVIDWTLGEALSEPKVARLLGAELPSEAIIYVAASMPIRDVEEFFPVREDPPRVLANRGANGIDGTVSAAFGAAAVTDGPTVLLIGDVALLHDIGGLLAAHRSGLALTVVLINNDGGGIFNFLPISAHPETFDEHVATPHGRNFAHAAALYGLRYVAPTDVDGFRAALANALESDTATIIEVRTDRVANRALHAQVEAGVRAALLPG